MIDFKVINAALNPATCIPQWLPDGKKSGVNWVAANPTRSDKNPGSFSVNLDTGVWCDFAGDPRSDRGGDLVGLYAYLFHGRDQGEAARELMRDHNITVDADARQRVAENPSNVASIEKAKPVPIMPVPLDVPQQPDSWMAGFKHPKFGKASRTWEYKSAKGRLLFYIARYDVQPRKQIVPWSWCKSPDGKPPGWRMRGITGATAKRPLYGLDKLAAYPDHDVIVVEGEKAADAAQELMGETCVVVTWLGGIETADRVEVKALAGRKVTLWPDFDSQRAKVPEGEDAASAPLLPMHEQPGNRAMIDIAKLLHGVAKSVHMIDYEHGEFSEGWDLADGQEAGWTGVDVIERIGARSRDPMMIAAGRKTAPLATETPIIEDKEDDREYVSMAFDVNPFGFPHPGKETPKDSIENLEYLLDQYGIRPRYNVISKSIEIHMPGADFSQDNHMEACLAHIGSLCSRNGMPRGSLPSYIITLADKNQYNPAVEWIDSKPWDGVDRLEALADSLDASDKEMARILLRRWMIGAVASAFEPTGFAMQGAIVLQGPQGVGKTTWIMGMANQNRNLIKESAILDPSKPDSVKQVISYWLVELGELEATFSKSDITALRGFLTNKMDELRMPYAKASSKFPRRTAFMASVNEHAYLRDETGNRRYWTIQCGEKMNAMHGIDMQQAWAQAKTIFVEGEQHNLTKDEMGRLAEANLTHTETNPIEDLIMGRFAWDKAALIPMTATDVLIQIGYDKPSNKQAKDAGTILRKATGNEPKKTNGRTVFVMPPLKYKKDTPDYEDENRPF